MPLFSRGFSIFKSRTPKQLLSNSTCKEKGRRQNMPVLRQNPRKFNIKL